MIKLVSVLVIIVFMPFCLSAFLSFSLCVFLSFCLSIFLSFCLSVFLSFCLSFCNSLYFNPEKVPKRLNIPCLERGCKSFYLSSFNLLSLIYSDCCHLHFWVHTQTLKFCFFVFFKIGRKTTENSGSRLM